MEMKKFKYTINVGEDKKLAKEVLYLLKSMGFKEFRYNPRESAPWVYVNDLGDIMVCSFKATEDEEITIQYLRDLVVLKRNSINDASFKDTFGDIWYVDSTNSYWMFENAVWREADEPLFKLEPIKKLVDKEVKMKEYLDEKYELRSVKQTSGDNRATRGWIEVPEGAEEYRENRRFYKNNGKLFYAPYEEWVESGLTNYKTLWKRNHTTSPNTAIQEKLKFIEKWLNGEKIQYILGIESDKSQWHNFTEGAMRYIKRSDIKFREAPKYVTINGVEFKSVEKLLKYVKNNFDLEDGE